VDDGSDVCGINRPRVGNQKRPYCSPKVTVSKVGAEPCCEHRACESLVRTEANKFGTTHRVLDSQMIMRPEEDALHLPGHPDRKIQRSEARTCCVCSEPPPFRLRV